MVEWIYSTLSGLGYHHPLHPPVTHIPVGLVIGAFLFALGSLIFNRASLAQTARHCILLALMAAPLAAVIGLMDWQHFYAGVWLVPIRFKMALAVVLIVLLLVAWVASRKEKSSMKRILPIYGLCLLTVTALGYFGGELVYGTKATAAEADDAVVQEGAELFARNCSGCHFTDTTETRIGPGFKGLFQQDQLPTSRKAVTAENIRAQIKSPVGNMPPFPDLTDEQIDALVAYLKTL